MEECFRDIHNAGAGYEGAKGSCRGKFNTQDTSCIAEIKTMRKTSSCYKYKGPHFMHNSSNNSSNKFQAKTLTQQTYKRKNYTEKFHNNKSHNMFPMGNLLIRHPSQVSQVKICQLVLTPFNICGENRREAQLKETNQSNRNEKFKRTVCKQINGNINGI